MAKKHVFVSFDYDQDRHYKNLLLAWDANKEFDFEIFDESLTVAVDSEDAKYIKARIKPKILAADYLLCIVGQYSGANAWIDWEIKTAVANGKPLIGVKILKSYVSPPALLNNGASWAMSWTLAAIKTAVDGA